MAEDKYHPVNFRLNRDIPFEKELSDNIRKDLDDDVNISLLIKVLLFAYYIEKREAEKVA